MAQFPPTTTAYEAIGVDGNVTLSSGLKIFVKEWNGDFQNELVDTTNFGAQPFRRRRVGLKGATGELIGYPEAGTDAVVPGYLETVSTGSPLVLIIDNISGIGYSIPQAVLSNFQHRVDIEGKSMLSCRWASNGVVNELPGSGS